MSILLAVLVDLAQQEYDMIKFKITLSGLDPDNYVELPEDKKMVMSMLINLLVLGCNTIDGVISTSIDENMCILIDAASDIEDKLKKFGGNAKVEKIS